MKKEVHQASHQAVEVEAVKKRIVQVGTQIRLNEVSQDHFCCSRFWQQSQGGHLNQGKVGIFVSLYGKKTKFT